jgi:hypothetical protein
LSYMIIASHLMAWNKNRCYVDLSPNFGWNATQKWRREKG